MNDTALRPAPIPQSAAAPAAPPVPKTAIRAAPTVTVTTAPASDRTQMWELLVTDGHVRAARIRRIQPWIIGLAVILLWAGILIARMGPALQPSTSVGSRVQERVSVLQARAVAAFTALGRLPPKPDKPDRLPSVAEIPDVVQALLTSLNTSNKLPDGNLTFVKTDEEGFWAGNWPTEQISYLKSGSLYLIGAYAHVGPATSQQAVRWVGAVKSIDGKWQYACLGWSGLYVPSGLPNTSPQSITLTLDPFLPALPKNAGSRPQS